MAERLKTIPVSDMSDRVRLYGYPVHSRDNAVPVPTDMSELGRKPGSSEFVSSNLPGKRPVTK